MPTLTWQIQIANPNLAPIRGLTEAVNGLRAATGQAATSLDTLTGHTQALSRQLAQTGQAAQQHGSALVGFFTMAASAATGFLAANVLQQIVGGLTNIGQAAITSAASMEQTRAGFTTLLGSAQQANALIAQLQQEANKSPFELANFRQGAQLLLGMGVAADQIVPRLRNVSNVVAAVGGTPETFNRITLALGQIQAKGKVSAEEINQLAENGVPGWDILAQALGKTRADVIDLAQQGQVSADVWNQAFAQFAQSDRIRQAAGAQSHTFNGLLSTIRDIGTALGTAFGGPLIAAVEPTLERIVASLQDPQVTATLAEWGAAAGRFVVGLIQAGQVAFQIAGQILSALKPVTDALGDLFGIQGGPAVKLPDFQPVIVGSNALNTNLTKAAESAKSVKDQIAELERTQRESNRASAEQQETYTHQKDGISEQIRLLQEKYDLENRTADRAELVAKIRKDEALAVDVVSSQGQAAAKRLVDEREQLRRLDRQAAFDAQKGTLEDQQRGIEKQAQLDRERNAQLQRDTQARVDALREGQQTPPPLQVGRGPDGRTYQGNSQDRDDQRQRAATGQAQATVGVLQRTIDDLIAKLHTLGGAPGAVIGAVLDDWNLLTGAFGTIGDRVGDMTGALDRLVTTLGGRDGLEGVFIAVNSEFQRLMASLAVVSPLILGRVGNEFGEFGDAITQTMAHANEVVALFKFQTGQGSFEDFAKAKQNAEDVDKQVQQRHAQFVQDDAQRTGTYADRIAQINKDIDAQQEAAFRAADARRGHPTGNAATGGSFGPDLGTVPDYGMRPDYTLPGGGGAGPQTYALPPHTGMGALELNLTGQIGVDEQGLLRVINMQISGKRLARALGDYASSGR